MSINFENNVFGLYATNVVTDAEYAAIDPVRRNTPNEQKVLTAIEVIRGLMAELRSDEQARVFHYAMGRMLAGVAYNTIYDDLRVTVTGNVPNVYASIDNGDTIDITDANGTENVVIAGAPFTSMDDLVADINTTIGGNVDVEAFNDNGFLGFRVAPTAGFIGQPFTLDVGAGPSLLVKAGLNPGDYLNPVEIAANSARDDAIAHFERSANPVDL